MGWVRRMAVPIALTSVAAACGGGDQPKTAIVMRAEGTGTAEVTYRVDDNDVGVEEVSLPWERPLRLESDFTITLSVRNLQAAGEVSCSIESDVLVPPVETTGEASARCEVTKDGSEITSTARGEPFPEGAADPDPTVPPGDEIDLSRTHDAVLAGGSLWVAAGFDLVRFDPVALTYEVMNDSLFLGEMVAGGDVIYGVNPGNEVVALSAIDGSSIWTVELESGYRADLIGGELWVGPENGTGIVRLDASTGEMLGEITDAGLVVTSITQLDPPLVAVADRAFDPTSMFLVDLAGVRVGGGEFTFPEGPVGVPTAVPIGNREFLLGGSLHERLYVIDESFGATEVALPVGGFGAVLEPNGAGGALVQVGGDLRWHRWDPGTRALTGPVGPEDGRFLAVEGSVAWFATTLDEISRLEL